MHLRETNGRRLLEERGNKDVWSYLPDGETAWIKCLNWLSPVRSAERSGWIKNYLWNSNVGTNCSSSFIHTVKKKSDSWILNCSCEVIIFFISQKESELLQHGDTKSATLFILLGFCGLRVGFTGDAMKPRISPPRLLSGRSYDARRQVSITTTFSTESILILAVWVLSCARRRVVPRFQPTVFTVKVRCGEAHWWRTDGALMADC